MAIHERKSISPIKLVFEIIVSIILIVFQLFIYYLAFIGSLSVPYIEIISLCVAFILVVHLYNGNDNVSYKLTWTIVILLFNVAGPLFYIFFGGGNNLPKRKYRKISGYLNNYVQPNDNFEKLKEVDIDAYKFSKLVHKNTGLYLYVNQGDWFYNDGALMFEEMLKEIDNAKKYIFLEYFIIASGTMFDRLYEHLKMASQRNIEIKILYDYVGCNIPKVLSRKDLKRLISLDNTLVASYNPFGVNLNLGINYRDHRKILLIDGDTAFVGGINIADEYIHEKIRFGFWRDNGMKIKGDACYNYLLIFAQNWYMSTKSVLEINNYKSHNPHTDLQGYVLPFGDGPNNRLNPAYDLYTQMIAGAKKSIFISTPYFVIDNEFVKLIIKQIKVGIDVSILVPEIADKKTVFFMAQSNFEKILKAGGKIYQLKSGFNHAKTLVVDEKYAIVGTINIDYRSMFLHFECCNLLIDTPSIKDISQDFKNVILESTLMDFQKTKKRNIFVKLFEFIVSILGPLV